jgi:hypothetical protein
LNAGKNLAVTGTETDQSVICIDCLAPCHLKLIASNGNCEKGPKYSPTDQEYRYPTFDPLNPTSGTGSGESSDIPVDPTDPTISTNLFINKLT